MRFENVRVLYKQKGVFISVGTPMDVISLSGCSLGNTSIYFQKKAALADYLPTRINMVGCAFTHPGEHTLLVNGVPCKHIPLKTSSSIESNDSFSARFVAGESTLTVDSDLTGLR